MKFLILSLLALTLFINCAPESGQKHQNLISKIDDTEFEKLIQQRNEKILFLNVWATWCAPCKEEFPDLIKLAESYLQSDVEIVGLNVDYPDEIETKIKPFLRQFDLNFKIYVQDFRNEGDFINRLNADWNGALPATFIFDRQGMQQAFLIGKKDYTTFRQEIEKVRMKNI